MGSLPIIIPAGAVISLYWGGIMRRRRKNGRRLGGCAMLILVVAAVSWWTADHDAFSAFSWSTPINVCEDSAIKEINTHDGGRGFLPPGANSPTLWLLERDSDNRITALRTDVIAVGKVKARHRQRSVTTGWIIWSRRRPRCRSARCSRRSLFTGMGPSGQGRSCGACSDGGASSSARLPRRASTRRATAFSSRCTPASAS